MSSPPTPNTSVKAAPLFTSRPKIRGTSYSLPSITTFNIFRKKLPPQTVEPYEVAPGMWRADATAKAYGYFDTNDNGHELRVQSTEPDIQAAGGKTKRQSVPIASLGGCKQTHLLERTEQDNTDKVKDESEAPSRMRQTERGEEGTKRGSNWVGVKQGTVRTVSRDDQLVERGANPRTGLISPFVVSDNGKDCLGGDYIAVANVGSTDPPSKKGTCCGKWKQDSLGWSLVESPVLSPNAQSIGDKMSRKVSTERFKHVLPVDKPGADNIDRKTMTDEQIKQYQEGIARAYKHGGGSIAMLDPDTLPSPRQWTPVGPSTPPAKLRKIQRKEVRSGLIRDRKSCDTVIKNTGIQASSISTPKKDIMERHKFSIIAPSNTPKVSSFESCEDVNNAMGRTGPFLGLESRTTCSQTMSATQSQSHLDPGQAHQNHQNGSESKPIVNAIRSSSSFSNLEPAPTALTTSTTQPCRQPGKVSQVSSNATTAEGSRRAKEGCRGCVHNHFHYHFAKGTKVETEPENAKERRERRRAKSESPLFQMGRASEGLPSPKYIKEQAIFPWGPPNAYHPYVGLDARKDEMSEGDTDSCRLSQETPRPVFARRLSKSHAHDSKTRSRKRKPRSRVRSAKPKWR